MKTIFFRKIFPVKSLTNRGKDRKLHTIGAKELVDKAARSTEKTTFVRLQKRYPGSERSKIRSFKIATIKGERKAKSLSERLGLSGTKKIQTQFKKHEEWGSLRPIDKQGSKKLRRFETYVTKRKTIFSKKSMNKNFLQDDDPTKALKSMRLDKEGSHMRSLPTEPRHIKGVGDVIDWDYNKYKKSELIKMSKGITAKGQKPFTNSQKVKIMEKGEKGLSKHIDRELSSDTTKIIGKFHAVKHGKTWTKSYGKFRVPAKEISGKKYLVSGPPEYVTKRKILDPITGKKIGEKITGSGTYKWRKGRKHKIFSIE